MAISVQVPKDLSGIKTKVALNLTKRQIICFSGAAVTGMADRKRLRTPNGVILGTPGSGKSFSAKREILSCFLITKDDIIICDPEGEYL